jgi:GAF domain-containing protein
VPYCAAPLPQNENRRLAALRACNLVEGINDSFLDRLTGMASAVFETDIALISLVAKDRQWFKSAVGLEAAETPRNVSFCAHAILGSDVMVVPDALEDDRFAGNPLVVGAPKIRFYAGAPLVTLDGYRLGTLCVIDSRPRPSGMSGRQCRLLSDFAALAMYEIERSC